MFFCFQEVEICLANLRFLISSALFVFSALPFSLLLFYSFCPLSPPLSRRTPFPTRCWISYLAHTERSMSSTEFAGTAPLIFSSLFRFSRVGAAERVEIDSLLPSLSFHRTRLALLLTVASEQALSRRLSPGRARAKSGRESGGKGARLPSVSCP